MESTKMTLPELMQTIDTFRLEYQPSPDPEIQKLCGYLGMVNEKLGRFLVYFEHQKIRIEQSQSFWDAALESLKEIVGEANPSNEDLSTDILDLLGDE